MEKKKRDRLIIMNARWMSHYCQQQSLFSRTYSHVTLVLREDIELHAFFDFDNDNVFVLRPVFQRSGKQMVEAETN